MNRFFIIGQIFSGVDFSHENAGERFFRLFVSVSRMSMTIDFIPVIISEYVADLSKFSIGDYVEVAGECRTHNDNGKVHVFMFANDIRKCEENQMNEIEAVGYVCKMPVFRQTPKGREITDIHIAVPRRFNKTDYLPCIAWGRTARKAKGLRIGDDVTIFGRFQSRDYIKEGETRKAFEISLFQIERADYGGVKGMDMLHCA